ncbi:PTS system D-fructose-specific IIB component (F1P-forming) (Frc family) /PTS system D-fructose-specific IIC component (F1P-forming) (Frc family) [Vibrio crassostreae]|uniref:PTS fructose transporter subunit IIC n=1 Tax=Vibrio crassostreae TaxID=246167 RepID=UPI001045C0A7|nr:PTS fructose transporter subunit IIBC [Vibrio crassostreae]TCN90869.1 PTS system D-fructose-specific IIB component (F1P-forming) (Frc family) /PTS system D-fructose-specific IIC component (F1P-forming) (Frc family) [Vibrio crassostreae]CAK2428325.1 PTS system D-fructose-specific IIB component (F1P-forming) (Frc family) /PTS system D-fructose-specific IIC component (F1P-forming) (Frc family) [Vibrio crassostreae]CAK2489818.1 PTS system D-fructose-specific IIB component (F1P-forming) (Frc famil
MKKIIAITGCPTGIAHTFMAESALKKAAKKAGVEIKVETNGAAGVKNQIERTDLEDIYGVIIAADKDVTPERFNGLPVLEVPVKDGVKKADELIKKVLDGEAPIRGGVQVKSEETQVANEKLSRQLYKHLMNGVSNMLPFVVAGGVLIAVSFLWGIYSSDPTSEQYNEIAAMLMKIGQQAFSIMVPVFAGFIASSIGGKPAMVAGFVGGLLANVTGAGFLGGILAGFGAGYLVYFLVKKLEVLPRQYEGLKSIFLLPILGTLIIGFLMLLLGGPIALINTGMMDFLAGLQDANPILLGVIIGMMCAFDFGGPVNKAAYVTGTLLLAEGNMLFMAAVSAACITPPLVVALATTIFKRAFDEEERTAGAICYVLGATHITEGAIPFVAKAPHRVIPIMMLASSISAVLSLLMSVLVPAPHGGFLILPVVSAPLTWVVCILTGSLTGAVLYGIYRTFEMKKLNVQPE